MFPGFWGQTEVAEAATTHKPYPIICIYIYTLQNVINKQYILVDVYRGIFINIFSIVLDAPRSL